MIVLAVENECKELLFHIKAGYTGVPSIRAVDLDRNAKINSSITFAFNEEANSGVNFSKPLSYLYEPNVAILKAGAFKWIGQSYGLSKLAPNTHLYTSDQIHSTFPGRVFKIID